MIFKTNRGFIAGAFDLLHPGHLYILERAKEECEWLVVGLHIDPSKQDKKKEKPIESVLDRYLRLKACKYVDEVIPYETKEDLLNILHTGMFGVRFLGNEYLKPEMKRRIVGKDIVRIVYITRFHTWSSTKLRHKLR